MQLITKTIIAFMALSLTACGGGGNSSPAPQSAASIPPTAGVSSVTVSGKITYDYVPHKDSSGLDYINTEKRPSRGVIVEAIDADGDILASTQTNLNGTYSLTLKPETNISIRAKAQLLSESASKWNFKVTDNTQNNQLYALQGSVTSTGKSANQSRDLHAAHGWGGAAYTSIRAAAPFAILDNIYSATEVFSAIDPNIDFPPLEFRWSVNNRTIAGDKSLGYIGTSAYNPNDSGGAIYILGEENRDTDEYDPHVILHEWGHYFEHEMSRTDTLGGLHSLNDRLDARVAFSEGWSNALSAIITGDPVYRDSSGQAQKLGFSFNLESKQPVNPGWFNEASIGSILYDIFDDAAESADSIAVGLEPIYSVMRSDSYKNTPVFTTIFAFTDGLRQSGKIDNAALNRLLDAQSITGEGPNGNGENNSGAIRSALPVYKEVTYNGPAIHLCSVDDAGVFNKLANREFIFLNLETAQDVTLSARKSSGDDNRDPDFNIWQGNKLINTSASSRPGEEILNARLEAGDYVIEVYDFFNINGTGSKRGDGCYNFSVTG